MAVLDQRQRANDGLQYWPERRHHGLQRGRRRLRQEEPRTLYQEHRRYRPAIPRSVQKPLFRRCLPLRLDFPHAAGDGCPAPKRERGYNRKIPQEQAGSHAGMIGSAIWGGLCEVEPGSSTGVHHHGQQETIAYVLSGICEIRWGAKGESVAHAKAGDFIHVPAFLPHMEINPSKRKPFRWVVVRSTATPVVINLSSDAWS